MSCDDNQFHMKRITRKLITLFSANIIRMYLCVCVCVWPIRTAGVILYECVCIMYFIGTYLRRKFAYTNVYIPMLIARSQGVSEIITLSIA